MIANKTTVHHWPKSIRGKLIVCTFNNDQNPYHTVKEIKKIPKGHSNSLVENKMIMSWLTNKTNRETVVHKTQHRN